MPTIDNLKAIIRQERLSREAKKVEDLIPMIAGGDGQYALESLIFFASPDDFLTFIERQNKIKVDGIFSNDMETQEHFLSFLAELALALRSFLPRWNLQSPSRHGRSALSDEVVDKAAERLQAEAAELAARSPAVAEHLLARWRRETVARLKAEQALDPESQAQALVGESIGACLDNLSASITHSHLRRIAEMRLAGKTSHRDQQRLRRFSALCHVPGRFVCDHQSTIGQYGLVGGARTLGSRGRSPDPGSPRYGDSRSGALANPGGGLCPDATVAPSIPTHRW